MRWTTEKRRMWEDHREYLDGLARVLRGLHSRRLIIMGDFNQRIGQGTTVPTEMRSALQETMPSGITIATSAIGLRGRRSIDHIALGHELAVESLGVIDTLGQGRRLSDHFGVYVYLSERDRPWSLAAVAVGRSCRCKSARPGPLWQLSCPTAAPCSPTR